MVIFITDFLASTFIHKGRREIVCCKLNDKKNNKNIPHCIECGMFLYIIA